MVPLQTPVRETDAPRGAADRRARSGLVAAALLRQAYRPSQTLAALLPGLLAALLARLGGADGRLHLPQWGTLEPGNRHDHGHAGGNGHGNGNGNGHGNGHGNGNGNGHSNGNGGTHAGGPAKAPRARWDSHWPLRYGPETLGELSLAWHEGPPADGTQAALVEGFAHLCALLVKRFELQLWAQTHLGRPLLLVGASDALFRLEAFVETAAWSDLPVLLAGEFGTEKALLATAVHACGRCAAGPLVEVGCADPAGAPAQWFEQARGGTLFLNGVDELPLPLQAQLTQQLQSRLCQWVGERHREVRVVASCTADLREQAREGRFLRPLLAELDFLSARVPPLRERPEDIVPLAHAAIERHGFDPARLFTLELAELCHAHRWPENLFELEQVMARLAVLNHGRPVGYGDVLLHAPQMAPDRRRAARPAEAPPAAPAAPAVAAPAPPDPWLHGTLARDSAALKTLPDALRRALLYLGEHHAEPVTLGQLARQAHVSASHLGYLFRTVLKTTFKSLLQRLRLERARQLLAADPHQRITDVALSVGFADLSHFEKCFRRATGLSPREFRRQALPG